MRKGTRWRAMSSKSSKNVNASNRNTKTAIGSADRRSPSARLRLAPAQQADPGPEIAEGTQPPALAAKLFHAGQQRKSQNRQNTVRHPDSFRRRQCPLACESRAHDQKQVVGSNQKHGKQRTTSAAAAPRPCPQRHRHQGKNEARHRESKPSMKLDTRLAPSRPVLRNKLVERAFGIAGLPGLCGHEPAELDGPIALPKSGDRIVVRICAREFVSGATLKVQLQLALFRFGNYNRVFRQCEA